MPEPRWFGGAGVGSDGRIYAFGGYVMPLFSPVAEYGIGMDSLVVYDPEANRWSRGPEVPPYRYPLRDPRMSFPGGQAINEVKMPHEVPNAGSSRGLVYWFKEGLGPLTFDPHKGAWTEPSPPIWHQDEDRWEGPVPIYHRTASATATDPKGRFYLIGGVGHPIGEWRQEKIYKLLATVEIYDPATNAWRTAAPMHRGRQLFAAAFGPDGKLYVFGGYGGSGGIQERPGESEASFAARTAEMNRLAHHALDSVEAYDPKTNTWSARAPMPLGVEGAAAALGADGRIYVVGGTPAYADPKPVRRVQVYDPRTDTWSEGPRLHTARQGHMVVATPDGRIWAIGGTNAYSVFHPRMLVGGDPATRGGPLASVEVLETKPRMSGAAP